MNDNSVCIDMSDISSVREAMRTYGDSEMPFFGSNEDGEEQIVSVNRDNVTIVTFQHNGWARTHVVWEDGTSEETFERI